MIDSDERVLLNRLVALLGVVGVIWIGEPPDRGGSLVIKEFYNGTFRPAMLYTLWSV